MRAFFVIFVLVGCVQASPPERGQEQALRIIWVDTYGDPSEPPPIIWRRDRCHETNGIYGTQPFCLFDVGGLTVAGNYEISQDVVEVGAPCDYTLNNSGTRDGMYPPRLSHTVLAHELMHAHQSRVGVDDPLHSRVEDWRQVDAANMALAARDL